MSYRNRMARNQNYARRVMMERQVQQAEADKEARIARVNAEQAAKNPNGLELPPWVLADQMRSQQPMSPQQPMSSQQSSTPPLQQLALHKRAAKPDSAALSEALREGA